MNKQRVIKIIFLSLALFLVASNVALAAPSWWPIVPCGLSVQPSDPGQPDQDYTQSCNPCELFHLGRNIIDFVLMGLMPPVAAGLFIWGGFLILMGGPNPALFAKGKQIFTTTFYGVLIILGSWLITNTIMMSVAQDSIEVNGTTVNIVTDWNKFACKYTSTASGTTPTPSPTPSGGQLSITIASLPDATVGVQYNQTLQASGGVSPYAWSKQGALPAGLNMSSAGVITGTPTAVGTATPVIKVEDNSSPKLSASKTFTLKVGTTSACDGATLAQKYDVPHPRQNAQELGQLISCVNAKLSGMIDQSQIYTYERTNDLCNYTRGENICGSCAHKIYSCHYGGRDGNQGALGVDFNAKAPATETQLYNALNELSATCNFGYIGFETDHTHISSKSCSGN